MICPFCKGNLTRSIVNFPVEIEKGFLIVKNLPADVCEQCEEVFIPDEIAESLEKMVETAKKEKVELEVISFEKVA